MLLNGENRFAATLRAHDLPALTRRPVTTLQLNLGKLCNQACRHCHVDAGPQRSEQMDEPTMDRVLALLEASPAVTQVDITGGAPELNPLFRRLVNAVMAQGRDVMVRCNLTVLHEPGQQDLHEFYAARRVHVVASLPCYTADNVDAQRGDGAFAGSVSALRRLNEVGYGELEGGPDPDDEGLRLDLVYNPLGPSLPPPQAQLEADYRQRLRDDLGLRFDRLLTLTNMPIHRFGQDLERRGQLAEYEQLLADGFNPAAVSNVMCRDLVSVDWDGSLSDCDFNQMVGMGLGAGRTSIFDLDSLDELSDAPIATAAHCLGCTAGQGSSCGGALTGAG